MRRTLSCFSALLFLFSLVFVSSAASPAENPREYLMSIGTPEEFLDELTETQIENLYLDCVEKNAVFSGYKTQIQEIPELAVTRGGDIKNSDLSLTMSTYTVTISSSTKVDEVRVHIYFNWLNGPKVKNTDGIAFNWDSALFQLKANSFYGYTYGYMPLDEDHQFPQITSLTDSTQGAAAWKFTMQPATAQYVKRGEFHFSLLPRYSMYKGDGSNCQMNLIYAHETNPFGNFSVSFSVVGVTIRPTGTFVDTMAVPYNYYT